MNDIIHGGRPDAQRRERHSWLPLPLLVLFNCVRISLCAAWTAVARLGRSDLLDRALEAKRALPSAAR